MVKKKNFLGLDRDAWFKIALFLVILAMIIVLKLRSTADTISPFDGFMALWGAW